jgi:hypothetical protein
MGESDRALARVLETEFKPGNEPISPGPGMNSEMAATCGERDCQLACCCRVEYGAADGSAVLAAVVSPGKERTSWPGGSGGSHLG